MHFGQQNLRLKYERIYYTLDVNMQCNNHFSYLKNEKSLKSVDISEIARKKKI